MLHIPGFPKFCSSRNLTSGRNSGERKGQLEGYSSRQCAFDDLQRCANSRWLTGHDHNRNYNFSMWPDNVPTILCYFLAAFPSLKVSLHAYGINHMFTLLFKVKHLQTQHLINVSTIFRSSR